VLINRTKEKLLAGEMVVGTHISLPSPAIAEICGLIGFDFIIIDMEHVLFNPETFVDIVRAAENSGVTPIFRPTKNDPDLMLPYLDAGAMGVWVPNVTSAREARQVVEAVKYGPLGNRGITSERPALYRTGPPVHQLLQEMNSKTLVSVSIESQTGIDNVEEICAVEGVDVVGMGPSDLAQTLGYPGRPDHPEVQRTIASLITRIRDSGRVAGIIARDAVLAKSYYELGARYMWTSVSSMLVEVGQGYLHSMKGLQSR